MSRLLFLSRWLPYPANNGSKLRILNLLRSLAQTHETTLLTFFDPASEEPNLPALTEICPTVHAIPYKPFNPRSRPALAGFFSLKPRSVLDTYSPEMAGKITNCLAAGHYDAVIASQIDMAAYAPLFGDTPALFEEAEVGVLYEQYKRARSWPRRVRYGLTWGKHRRYLTQLLSRFAACTVVSERERRLLAEAAPAYSAVEVIPNGLDLAAYDGTAAEAAANSLIFTGSLTYAPNYQAMRWFLEEVYPLIYNRQPGVTLTITGDHAGLPLPDRPNVALAGFVPDARPLIASSAVSLAPIWQGGGTRLKILEAMALRVPVVATSKGAEGLEVENGRHLLLADTPQDFADAVLTLLKNPDTRYTLAAEAHRLLRAKYDWPAIMPRFLKLVEITVDS